MTDRKTITIDADLHAQLQSQKRGSESWTAFLQRLQQQADEAQADPQEAHPVDDLETLTEDHIDDIATRTARRTADEVETRLR